MLWALPFLSPSVPALAWLVPALAVLSCGESGSFFRGWLCGLFFHLSALHWLLFMPVHMGAAVGWLCLSAYCALYPALWILLTCRLLRPRRGAREGILPALASMGWAGRQVWALGGAAMWTSSEMLQSRLLTGFPWNLLGSSQIEMLPLVQVASLAGVHGVSFLMVWTSLSLLSAVAAILARPALLLGWARDILPAGLCLVFLTVWGLDRIGRMPQGGNPLRIALIQPSVDQRLIWEGLEKEQRLTDILGLSREALAHGPDLLVWPESGVPQGVKGISKIIRDFVGEAGIPLVFNDTHVRQSEAEGRRKYYNAAFLMDSEGRIRGTAHKRRLVVFGEYIPFAGTFPFLRSLIPVAMDLDAGTVPGFLEMEHPPIAAGVLICFEDAFPSLARDAARKRPGFLLNLTNAGWFGRSRAQWQQTRGAAFRAVECGLPLVRCANNGITCSIDPAGRIDTGRVDTLPHPHGPGYRIVEVTPRGDAPPTPYLKWGDAFGWTCLFVSLSLLTGSMKRRHPEGIDAPA